MGESMVELEAQHMETKMGEPLSVGVSVSFGKYENDALCWEKWSTFSPNKYLEEVGKCSTPGSVAQKKAFFEAHYKKIAAMKAEADLLPSTSDEVQIKEEDKDMSESNKVCHSLEDSSECENEEQVQVVDESAKSQEKPHCAAAAEDERFGCEDLAFVSSKLEEAALVNDESMKLVKHHFQMDSDPQQTKQDLTKPQMTQKVLNSIPTKVENKVVGMKKKPASVIPSATATATARLSSKPKATPTPLPAAAARSSASSSLSLSLSSSKKKKFPSSSSMLSSSSSKSKNPSYLSESRPTSLHLSISMNSDTASSSVTSSRRRSLFMEQMGDKDIVKRAFKTFQNRLNQLPSHTPPKQVPTASTSRASQKENERSRKVAEKINPARGPTWKSVSSGSLKGVGVDERRLKGTPTSVVLRSNERAERRKEFFKNLEEKSNARDAERSQLSSKSKEVKDAEMKKLRQNLTFKAKPMPSFYRSSQTTTDKDKETIKNGTPRRPDSHR